MQLKEIAALDAPFLAREWNLYWHTGISPLAGWLPAPDQPWRVTARPPEFPVGHAAHGLPPFRNLLFDPKLRETLLLLVGQMEAVEFRVAGESAGIEAWWMEQLAVAESGFLCDVGLQCLARCSGYHGQVAELLIGNLRQFYPLEAYDKSPGLTLLGKASGSRNQAAVIEYLLRNVQHEFEPVDTTIVEWCFKVLGAIGSSDVVPFLLKCLGSEEHRDVRWGIDLALGECVNESHVPLLLECLGSEENSDVRGSIAFALGKIGSSAAVPLLLKCLGSEEDSDVRRSIADALGKIGFDALDTICAAWEDLEGEKVQKDLARFLYTLATIDPEERSDLNKN